MTYFWGSNLACAFPPPAGDHRGSEERARHSGRGSTWTAGG